MCGLVGYLAPGPCWIELQPAIQAIAYRGPDGRGDWHDESAGIGLGHARLSIIDLSPAGAQPMHSHCGRFVIAFNGEIYNFRELRLELDGSGAAISWRGHSDTEVLLECIARWGFEPALRRLNGMFAIALWDRREHTLCLARDRFGEKPLYFGWSGARLVFASELKALRALPDFEPQVDRDALPAYLRFGFVPAPRSILRGIYKMRPGHYVCVPAQSLASAELKQQAYWDMEEVVREARATSFVGSEDAAVDEMDRCLRAAVAARMESDVPLGGLLSGGVDSSIVIAMMQAQSGQRVRSFSIGYSEPGFDESAHARAVAAHLGTEHTEFHLEPGAALEVIPELPAMFDEPFGDCSQIPTYLVSRLARTQITVALSGDGGDELFGGYNRYSYGQQLWNLAGRSPMGLRHAFGSMLTALSPDAWNRMTSGLIWLPAEIRGGRAGEKLHKLALAVEATDERDLYLKLASIWLDPARTLANGYDGDGLESVPAPPDALSSFAERAMYRDAGLYLPGDILTKVDRASMAVGLEVRVPMLDPELFTFAWRLPLAMKVRGHQGKYLLRRVLDRYVPRQIVERPKQGFAVPVGRWMRSTLRDWCEALLDENRLRREGYFDATVVRRCWDEHLCGKRDWDLRLWSVLMFQAWLDAGRRIAK